LFAGEKEEIELAADRLTCRCLTVDVSVTVPRSTDQELALKRGEQYLQNTEEKLRSDIESAKDSIQGMLNACLTDCDGNGPINMAFQKVVLSCAMEDQKQIRQKLNSWMLTFSSAVANID